MQEEIYVSKLKNILIKTPTKKYTSSDSTICVWWGVKKIQTQQIYKQGDKLVEYIIEHLRSGCYAFCVLISITIDFDVRRLDVLAAGIIRHAN